MNAIMKTLLRAVMISVWFMALTFPVLSLKRPNAPWMFCGNARRVWA